MQQFIVEAGDIIVSCAGTIGEIYELPPNAVSGVFNQALMRVRINATLIDKNIFIKVFSSMIDSFSKIYSNGSAIKNIPPFADLKKTNVFLPTQNEQYKISRLISLLDERIATQNKIIEDLKKLKSAITNLLFHSIIEVNTVRLGDIAHITNGVGDVQDANTEYRKDWYPFFDRSEELKWFPTYSFDKEAIIYAGEGQSFYPRYYKGKFALHQRCYAITDFTSCILPRYCYHFMTTLNSYFIRNSVGSTVPSLRMDIFQKAEIKLPPISKQQHICKIIDALYAKLEVEHNTLNSLQLQKQHMLRQMFI